MADASDLVTSPWDLCATGGKAAVTTASDSALPWSDASVGNSAMGGSLVSSSVNSQRARGMLIAAKCFFIGVKGDDMETVVAPRDLSAGSKVLEWLNSLGFDKFAIIVRENTTINKTNELCFAYNDVDGFVAFRFVPYTKRTYAISSGSVCYVVKDTKYFVIRGYNWA